MTAKAFIRVGVPRFKRSLPFVALFVWWGFTAIRMVLSAHRDPGPTGLAGDLPNWHNRPGELQTYLALTLGELAVVLAILRPRSYHRSWGRAVMGGVIITPWLLLFGTMMIHSGGVMVMHFVWLGGLWAGVWLLAGISVLLTFARKTRRDEQVVQRVAR
jgi:hypothetical protein